MVSLDARLRPVRAVRGGALGKALGHDDSTVVILLGVTQLA